MLFMETLKSSETLVEGLVTSKQDGSGNLVEGTFKSFDLGKEKCAESVSASVVENGCIDTCNVKGLERVSNMGIGRGVDSSYHGDVPMKGISLFVELTGGVTNDVSLGHKLDDGLSNRNQHEDQECRVNVGDFVWAIVKKQSWWPGIVCDASNAPKEAAKVQKPEDCLLVRCFGNGSYFWCLPYQLKPFVGHFEHFSKLSKSKSFVGALEKAVAEFGHRVKSDFTCSCFSKTVTERRGDVGNLSVTRFEPATFIEYIKDLARDISMPSMIDYAIKQNFLSAFYRSLGHCQIPMHQLKPVNSAKAELTSRTPSKIKTEEEIGFFNEEMNTQTIKDINFAMGDDIKGSGERSEKGYETRERRKSRFLSFPYMNRNAGKKVPPVPGEHGLEESRVDTNKGGVDLNKRTDQPVKKPRKKWCRKQVKHDLPGKGVQTNVRSSDVISELHCAALDCLFPRESKKFDSVERFITGFRKWTFNDVPSEITIEQTVGEEFVMGMQTHQIFPGLGVQSEKGMEMGMERTIDVVGASMQGQTHQIFPELGVQSERGSGMGMERIIDVVGTGPQGPTLRKKMRKKRSKFCSQIIDFQNAGSLALEAPSMVNKRMEVGADEGLQNNNVMEALSNLNGKCTVLNFGDLPATVPPPCKLIPKRRKKDVASDTNIYAWNSNVSALPNVNGYVDLEEFNQATVFQVTSEIGSAPPCFPGNHGEPQAGTISAIANTEPKKRGRKRKTMDFQATAAGITIMPDLNENGADKKKGKRVKKKEEIGVACIDLVYNKVQQDNGDVRGTAFLLKFSSDHPLPSSQELNSRFCKYGPLVESETQVSNENLSGQVVFLDSSSAGEAFWGLQNDQPFGQALVNYRIQHLAGADSTVGFKTPIKSPGLKPLQQGGIMDSQAIIVPPVIPNLNGNTAESKLLKRSKIMEDVQLPSMDLGYSKVQQQGIGEVAGTALLLKFSPGHQMPSNEDLNLIFRKYGALNEFETQVSIQNLSGQVVFVDSSSAGGAVEGLENDRPFGQALISYRVEYLYSAIRKNPSPNPIKIHSGLNLKPPCQKGESPDLAVIRKNLEMMRLMLEKAGDTLSPEMRGKLESEVKGLMNKMSTMDGSSSSSL